MIEKFLGLCYSINRDKEEQLLDKIFGYEFKNRRCKTNKIMQRKDLTKAIREASIND